MPDSIVMKPALLAVIGVTVPIAIEYGAKGYRIGSTEAEPTKGYKVSGVVGVGLGVVEIGLAYAKKPESWFPETDEGRVNRASMAAMGGAKLATGASILILDELRKQALYAFRKKRGAKLPIGREGLEDLEELERVTYPIDPLVEEI